MISLILFATGAVSDGSNNSSLELLWVCIPLLSAGFGWYLLRVARAKANATQTDIAARVAEMPLGTTKTGLFAVYALVCLTPLMYVFSETGSLPLQVLLVPAGLLIWLGGQSFLVTGFVLSYLTFGAAFLFFWRANTVKSVSYSYGVIILLTVVSVYRYLNI